MGWLGRKDPLQIVAFLNYGTEDRLYIRGRALEDETIDLAQKGIIKLLLNSWKRFETDEIRNTPLQVRLPDDRCFEVVTDDDGYYLLDERVEGLGDLVNEEGWVNFEISFREEMLSRPILRQNRFPGAIMIPNRSAAYGIITDIDDTILHTGVTSYLKWQVIANTVFKGVERRIPFQGAPELYHRLHRGRDGTRANPVFYVSHSPWNLYRYLEFFLSRNRFPKGPILLRSMASFWRRKKEDLPHKLHEIEKILQTYPSMPFILIGDSGERDADIYLEVARRFPSRVLAIYLRSVRHSRRVNRVRELIGKGTDVPVLLVDQSEEVTRHAESLGIL
ncbi:App1 family protein [Robiginitalea sp. SC105]|uniref:App1 family protein n=1 Tax=Robiginitalea sp. SC105 TaxID=2762332 RepID=UPI001639F723|nr:phosphatase domain-containing protein [Robiginitalea sp. SC105]MBC2838925.1 DUF2183 domain-containing protein [Robiginitalea sp. SC105]